jgi:hypothetical protein
MEKNESPSILRGFLVLIFGIILLFHALGIMQNALNWFLGFIGIYLIIYGLIQSGLWENMKEIWYKNAKSANKEK